jgi:hypothetical protein
MFDGWVGRYVLGERRRSEYEMGYMVVRALKRKICINED